LVNAQSSRIRELADIVRENDQLIYQMANRMNWTEMRPFFNELQKAKNLVNALNPTA